MNNCAENIAPRWIKLVPAARYSSIGQKRLKELARKPGGIIVGYPDPDSKRGYIGIYHLMSEKHLQKYVDEFTYRFNTRNEKFKTIFPDVMNNVANSSNLPYKVLTQ